MKRVASSPCDPVVKLKTRKTLITGPKRTSMDESGPSGLSMAVDPGGGEANIGSDGMSLTYNVPTNNRFAILPIPIPEASTLRVPVNPKPRKPPAFHVFEPVNTIRTRLAGNPNIVIQNRRNCLNVIPNTVEEHKTLYTKFKLWQWKFHTQAPEPVSAKKFVLHDLNTFPVEDIMEDLNAYGLQPDLITTIPVKRPRYPDQAVYVVHYDKSKNMTLELIRQAKYIQRTVARWEHYVQNGDGIIICSRCSCPGHSATFCNRPVKCKVCSDPHLTNECPLIVAKRHAKKTEISSDLLKCPLCNGKHTAGYRACPGRLAYINNRANRQRSTNQTYNDAPIPLSNPWTNNQRTQRSIDRTSASFPPLLPDHRIRRNITDTDPSTQPVFNNPHYYGNGQIGSSHQSAPNNKFNTGELFDIFLQMIDVVEKCNNKADQLRALGQIVSVHLSK